MDVDLTTFAGMVFGLCYLVAAPLFAFWLFGRVMNLALWNLVLGAGAFLIQFETAPTLNFALFGAASHAGLGRDFIGVALFCLTIALSVGLRWLALRFIATRSIGSDAGVALGIGYGGCEIVAWLIIPRFNLLKLAVRASAGDAPISLTNSDAFAQMLDIAWVDAVGKAIVAIVLLSAEIAVSTLIWVGVRDRNARLVLAASGLLAAYLLPMYVTVVWSQPLDYQSIFNEILGLLVVGWLAWGRSLPLSWLKALRIAPSSTLVSDPSPGVLRVWSDQRSDRDAPE